MSAAFARFSCSENGKFYKSQPPRRGRRSTPASRREFFDDPGFRLGAGSVVSAFGYAAGNAWTLGWADTARERIARMIAAAGRENPYDVALAEVFAANLAVNLREYERA